MDYVGKTCVDMKCKKELGWQTEGLSTQRMEPPFLLNKAILPQQMDKSYVTLAKNMHIRLLKFLMKNMFQFYFH